MREIKFRAWINGEMLSPSRTETEMAIRGWIQQESYILMQYTGLKDKNGREIYEGDIIRGMHDFGPGGMHERTGIIEWRGDGYLMNYWEDYEVIGNIYENPELVKEVI